MNFPDQDNPAELRDGESGGESIDEGLEEAFEPEDVLHQVAGTGMTDTPEDSHMNPGQLTWVGLLLEGALVAIALAIAWFFGFFDKANPMSGWFQGNWATEIVIGSLLSLPLLVLVLFILPKWKRMAGFFELVDDKLTPLFKPMNITQIALISLSAGVGEEILFRWCLQGGLESMIHPVAALVIVSLFFGLMHYLNTTYFLLASALGIILGVIYWYGGPLVAIACHAMYDFLAILQIKFESDD